MGPPISFRTGPCATGQKWFAGKPNIELIKWPGSRPDINPIENVWAWMNTHVVAKLTTKKVKAKSTCMLG